jgi:hypothetical protein
MPVINTFDLMKKYSIATRVISMILAASVLFSGCTGTTLIQTTPPGAKIYLNGEPVGTSPYRHSDTRIVGSLTTVDIEKPGYETLHTSFVRDEEVDVGAIIGGFFVLVPFLWTMKYKPSHHYELTPLSSLDRDAASPIQGPIKTKSEKLRELKDLYEANLINAEDYEKQKARILAEE